MTLPCEWTDSLIVIAAPQVLFAGYKSLPSPASPFSPHSSNRRTLPPLNALERACTKLVATLLLLEAKFKREFSFKDAEGAAPEDPYDGLSGLPWGAGKDLYCTVRYMVSRQIFSIVNNFRRRKWNTCFNNKRAPDRNSSSLHHPFILSTTTLRTVLSHD